MSQFVPRMVDKAPCQEIVETGDGIDMLKFPVLRCWPGDGGRFITLPMVVTKDPESGVRNTGMYRMQVYDGKTAGMHWHPTKDGARHFQKSVKMGKDLEAAVAIGADPAVVYAATAPVPEGVDEFLFAGFLRQSPVELVKCKAVDLEVPANSEIVLEGFVDKGEMRPEGPFGDHTGFYSPADNYPVFHITCVTQRHQPVYQTTVVGKPPMEDCFLGKASERIFLPLLRIFVPEITDINLPVEGVFHNCAIVSVRKRYPGQARKVMQAIWGSGQMMFTKIIIVVDENVNVADLSEVAWKTFNNIDPKRDILIVEGPVDVLDHASDYPGFGSKIGIDATRKWKEEGILREWPCEIEMSHEIKERVTARWKEYGL
jgi:4-hydroxy-3-polyprenylbenzoate decarboxylase